MLIINSIELYENLKTEFQPRLGEIHVTMATKYYTISDCYNLEILYFTAWIITLIALLPAYIRHMRKFGIEWELMSDTRHMRYGPERAIIIGLVHEYANQVVREIGVPVYVNVKPYGGKDQAIPLDNTCNPKFYRSYNHACRDYAATSYSRYY